MTINDKTRDEKLQNDINREAGKIPALSSGEFEKYEFLTGEELLPSNKKQIIEQAKFTYSPLGKAFEKQIKTIGDQEEKQIKTFRENGKNQLNIALTKGFQYIQNKKKFMKILLILKKIKI